MEPHLTHIPVLLAPFLHLFAEDTIPFFLDGTVGGGGHARAFLEAHPEVQRLYGIDQDPDALQEASRVLAPFQEKVSLLQGNFRDLDSLLAGKHVQGILLDLGVSSMQLDRPEKGFSFSKEGPLDMRMNPHQSWDAATVVNTYSEKELADIFWKYGEERRSRHAARAIILGRARKKIATTEELCVVLRSALPWKGRGNHKIHPMTRVFQALRIYVNDELGALEEGIEKAFAHLVSGGKLVIISFHSLEDRIVKHRFRRWGAEGEGEILTKKPLEATFEEVCRNPRSRCAKMRCLRKI